MEKKTNTQFPMGATLQGNSQNYEGATLSYDEAQKGSFNIMEKKQTAVEWYANASHELIVKKNNGEITNVDFLILHHNLFYEAQKMEKEQIEVAFAKSYLTGCEEVSYNDANKASENYYNETYGGIQC
jgi:hypothetical protein